MKKSESRISKTRRLEPAALPLGIKGQSSRQHRLRPAVTAIPQCWARGSPGALGARRTLASRVLPGPLRLPSVFPPHSGNSELLQMEESSRGEGLRPDTQQLILLPLPGQVSASLWIDFTFLKGQSPLQPVG